MTTLLIALLACTGGQDSASSDSLLFGDEAGRAELPVAWGLWVDSRQLFACGGDDGIYVLTIEDPHAPVRTDHSLVPCGALDGETGRVYTAAGTLGMQALHPGTLSGIGEYVPDFPVAVLTSDPGAHRSYVAGWREDPLGGAEHRLVVEGVATWQVESLTQHSRIELPDARAVAIAFDRQTVVVADDTGGLTLLDDRLETATALSPGGVAAGPTALALSDGVLWAALGAEGLIRVDVATQAVAAVDGIDDAWSVAAVGDRLYVGTSGALRILDLSDGAEVDRVVLDGLERPSAVWVEQGLAYVADGADGALVVVVVDEGLR